MPLLTPFLLSLEHSQFSLVAWIRFYQCGYSFLSFFFLNTHCPRLSLVWPGVFLLPKAVYFLLFHHQDADFSTRLNHCFLFSSVQLLSRVRLFVTPWTHARPPCPSPTPGGYPNSCPLSLILCWALSFHLQSFSASGSFQISQLFTSGGQSIGVSASASVLPMNIQDWFPLGWVVGSPYSPRDSQESSPTPQFKNINSSVLSFPYSPTLTSIHDHWKNHSFN